MSIFLVFPGLGVVVCSQERMAKKKATMESSAATAGAVLRVSAEPAPLIRWRTRRNFGVIAFWRLGAGSRLSKALRSCLTAGRRILWSSRWKGLGRKRFRNAEAT
jgi:hypothetical protein